MSDDSLTAELALLSYDEAGNNRAGSLQLGYGLAGAVLLELTLAGRLDLTDGRLTVVDPTPIGRQLPDEALNRIAAEPRPRKPKDWVGRLSKGLPERVLDGLVAAGTLRREQDRVLLIFPRTRYPSPGGVQPPAETEARQRMRQALTGTGPVPACTAALISLVHAIGLDRKVFRDLPRDLLKRRIAEISEADWASAATRAAIAEMQAAIIAAVTTVTTAAVVTTTN